MARPTEHALEFESYIFMELDIDLDPNLAFDLKWLGD